MKPIIGITLGDVAGIGPEVVAKALAEKSVWKGCEPWVYGPSGVLAEVSRHLGFELEEILFGHSKPGRLLVRPVGKVASKWIGCGRSRYDLSRIAVDSVRAAARDVLAKKIHAVVTAPIHKAGVVRAGIPFVGHTEFLAELAGVEEPVMMMTSPRLKVALVTTHIPLKKVGEGLTVKRILCVITLFNDALKNLGIRRPRMALASLNPHGGEDGGVEEKEVLVPAIRRARKNGLRIGGPISSDALFYQAYRGHYDGIVAMYHDQGLSPLKMVAFDEAVNVTLGLPFIRTSPDHGTAYDIAGKGIARPTSMIEAIRVAVDMVHHSNEN